MKDSLENKLMDTLYRQFVILGIIEDRFSILKSTYEEYKSNNKGAHNSFMFSNMYVYRTCVIIDLCKLFIVPKQNSQKDIYKGDTQHNNFYYVINKYRDLLGSCSGEIEQILNDLSDKVQLIVDERNQELVHKDSSTGTDVKLDVNHMDEIETLVVKSREIIEILFKAQDCEIILEKDEAKISTLKKVIEFLKTEKA
ncbi:MAG: hypothetical protein ACI7YS_13020 [Flavobacterium sp.]